MKVKLTKSFWLVAALLVLVALFWFPCAPKELSPATAYFGLGAVVGVVYAGYRYGKRILEKSKKPAQE